MMKRTILLVFAIATTLAQAQSVQDLADRYDRAYASERYELALKTAEQILDLYPESAWWQFNTGTVLARLGRTDESIEHLRRCADLGFSGLRSFEQNADLDPLRSDERFEEILDQVRTSATERMNAFQDKAKRHDPLLYIPDRGSGDRLLPIIIALHGTGMDGRPMHDALLETAKDQGMILVSPDALRASGNGFSWTYRDESEWFVEHLIDRMVEEHGGNPNAVYLIGFSQGANIALNMGRTHPSMFRGIIPICGHYESQVATLDGVPSPFYLMTGARDNWRGTYAAAKRDFRDAGGEAEIRMLPGLGHQLPQGRTALREFKKAFLWFERVQADAEQAP
tara:strand:- start:156312 stop:157328 length:1017 start_codon:yes stop_codon:yes gene_type:complete